jgi:hypothetical protein
MDHTERHYLTNLFFKRARETATTTNNSHITRKIKNVTSQNNPTQSPMSISTCMSVTLSCKKYDNGITTLRVLLDTRGVPIVFITATNQFQKQFFMITSYADFLQYALKNDRTTMDSLSDVDSHLEESKQMITSIEQKHNIEREFLMHTPAVCAKLAVDFNDGQLKWMDDQEMKKYNLANKRRKDEAVTKIQACARGRAGRCRVDGKRRRKESILLQKKWYEKQKKTVRARLKPIDEERLLKLEMQGQFAATNIQKIVRRHQKRHNLEWRKRKKNKRQEKNREEYLRKLRLEQVK